ncbi:hypothetical protein ACOMHN_052666 [Nucella lapillus]
MSMMRARVRGHCWVDHPAAAVMEARVPGQWVDCPAAVVMEAREQGRCWIDHPAVAVMEARVQGRHWVDRPSVGFNESRFITICVCTSMAISIGFLHTYLASERNLVKTLIMMLLVFLNHSMALVFLILPKVYAMVYIPETTLSSFKRSAFRSGIGKGPPGLAMSTSMTASVVLQDTLCVKRVPD